MSGSRRAATSGGRRAFRIAITRAAASAPQKSVTWAPGTTQAPTSRAKVTANQANTSLAGLRRGRSGAQVGLEPKPGGRFIRSVLATASSNRADGSGPSSASDESQGAEAAADPLRAFAGTSLAEMT